MNRIATFIAVVALCNVSRGEVIDLLANPSALPSGKPSTLQVQATTTVDGNTQIVDVTLDACTLYTTSNVVAYYQLTPVTLNFAGVDGADVMLHDLSSVLDPTGSFSVSYTDFGAPSNFSTTFNFPAFAPTLFGTVSFTGSASGSVTDGTAVRDGVSYTPTGGNPGVFKYELFDTMNASITSFFLDPGSAFAAGPPDSHVVGPYDNTGSPVVVSAGPNGVGTVVVTSSFTGSGGTDQYAFTGRWDLVPEPSTMVLAFLAAAGLSAKQSASVECVAPASMGPLFLDRSLPCLMRCFRRALGI